MSSLELRYPTLLAPFENVRTGSLAEVVEAFRSDAREDLAELYLLANEFGV